MLRLDVLLCGAVGGSVITALTLFMLQPDRNDDDAGRRQEHAHEEELAPTRHRLPSASTQFSSSVRLESGRQHSVDASAFAQGAVRSSIESSSARPADPPPSLTPEQQHEWKVVVTGTLQAEAQRRLGRRLPQDQERRLVDTLARL